MNEEQYADILASQQLQQQLGANSQSTQQQLMYQEMDKGLAEEQLDLSEIIKNIYKLLTGKKIVIDEDSGKYSWSDSDDNFLKTQLRVLSDYGVQKVMERVVFYVNKSVLLSSYSESEINRIMYDVTTCLNDFVLMRYEGFFYEPTIEECIDILKKKIEYRKKLRMFAIEMMGGKPDAGKINHEVIMEMENKLEYEIQKIKEMEREKRINEYDSITMEIEHQIYNTYKRAEGGTERGSLRRHSSFSEVRALQPESRKTGGGMFSWLK